jgi:hypothetical protein
MSVAELRRQYHQRLCRDVLRINRDYLVNIADKASRASRDIAQAIVEQFGCSLTSDPIPGQELGSQFELATRDFLEQAFALLHHLRPGQWRFSLNATIASFDQYHHLAAIQAAVSDNPQLRAALGGDYLITPDIVVARYPVTDEEINTHQTVVGDADVSCHYSSLRARNQPNLILHASISCKWTIRSDRAQNVRTEGLNLIRNRKGRTPHVMVVTAEPLPTRLASVALGTGDVDHVYHFALNELIEAVNRTQNDAQLDMLMTLIDGHRLRDISDLPLDLAI